MKHIAVIFVLLACCVLQVKGDKDTFEKILSSSYDSIRIEMMKTACAIEGIRDSAFLAELVGGRVDSALVHYRNLSSNNLEVILQQASKAFDGGTLGRQDSLARHIRASMMGRILMCDYKKEEEVMSSFSLHKKALDSLFDEAKDYLEAKKTNKLADFQKKHKNSKFCTLISQAKANKEEHKQMIFIILGIVLSASLILVIAYFAYALRKSNKKYAELKNQMEEKLVQKEANSIETVDEQPVEEVTVPKESVQQNDMEVQVDEDNLNAFAEHHDGWSVVGASVIGNSHISMGLPCQDNNKYAYLRSGWGVAITSDGAGSAEHSDIGSRIVVERCVHYFRSIIEQKKWIENDVLPSEDEWISIAYSTLKAIRDDLEKFATAKQVDFKSLSATAIVVIHSPKGFLTTHVGDGRAGYLDDSNEWKPLTTPHKGEEANQTIFLTSDFWNLPYYVMSGVLVPESHVIKCCPKAFTLISDGCEHTSWQCYTRNEETGIYSDPNQPHAGFFNGVINKLNDGVSPETRKQWGRFLKNGNSSFENEPDDKTMIVGVFNKTK